MALFANGQGIVAVSLLVVIFLALVVLAELVGALFGLGSVLGLIFFRRSPTTPILGSFSLLWNGAILFLGYQLFASAREPGPYLWWLAAPAIAVVLTVMSLATWAVLWADRKLRPRAGTRAPGDSQGSTWPSPDLQQDWEDQWDRRGGDRPARR
jgi:hypothetical protein